MERPSADEGQGMWSVTEMIDLIKHVVSMNDASKKFHYKNFGLLDWDSCVKVVGRTADECEEAFKTMAYHASRALTISDVCGLALSKLEDGNPPLKMIPNFPKHPVSAVFLYMNKKAKVLRMKDPSLSLVGATKQAAVRYNSLSKDKKDKYKAMFDQQMAVYKMAVKGVVDSNPNSSGTSSRVLRLSGFDLYWKHKEIDKKCASLEYHQLKDKKKLVWIWKAIEEYNRKVAECEENPHGGEAFPQLHLTVLDRKLLRTSAGVWDKPAKTLLGYYRSKSDLTTEAASEQYRMTSQSERDTLAGQLVQELTANVDGMKSYMEKRGASLSGEEKDYFELHLLTYQKLIRQFSKPTSAKKRTLAASSIPIGNDDEVDKKFELLSPSMPKKRKTSKGKTQRASTAVAKVSQEDSSSSDEDVKPSHLVKQTPMKTKTPQASTAVAKVSQEDSSSSDEDVKPSHLVKQTPMKTKTPQASTAVAKVSQEDSSSSDEDVKPSHLVKQTPMKTKTPQKRKAEEPTPSKSASSVTSSATKKLSSAKKPSPAKRPQQVKAEPPVSSSSSSSSDSSSDDDDKKEIKKKVNASSVASSPTKKPSSARKLQQMKAKTKTPASSSSSDSSSDDDDDNNKQIKKKGNVSSVSSSATKKPQQMKAKSSSSEASDDDEDDDRVMMKLMLTPKC